MATTTNPNTDQFEIMSDGVTVWVNVASGCIGRFGLRGIDVHRSLREQSARGECLFCTHVPVEAQDWELFVEKMREHHGIDVPDDHKPLRFRNPTRQA